jgi:hypothetical protein
MEVRMNDKREKVITKLYTGSQIQATDDFRADTPVMAEQGYYPTSQSWAAGTYGCAHFLVTLFLCLFIIGFFIFAYMLFVKPPGTLSVTYELREA